LKKRNNPENNCRRKFLLQAPIVAVGLLACMNEKSEAGLLLTGNYRRKIDSDACIACGVCAEVCPTNAIQSNGGVYTINPNLCIGCGACDPECPVEAIEQGTLIVVPSIDTDECVACGACEESCPTGAIQVASVAVINPSLCSGCRDCVPVCPAAAIS
jgi:formate hydrogenlyase subunit 6/NADH:ubiquinone oxidoreductase subunit I